MGCIDHKGNSYKDIVAMCKHYGISTSTYYKKLNAGYSKADILNKVPVPVMDHKGNEFKNVEEMCDYYNINRRTFYRLRKEGKTVSEIFNTVETKTITDKYGNKFKNISQFCNFYDIRVSQYYYYTNRGKTVDDIVNMVEDIRHSPNRRSLSQHRSGKVINFEGVVYDSVDSLCRTYGIKQNTFYRRRERGFTLEECVYGKPKNINTKIESTPHRIYDHLGNEFKNVQEMCKFHNVKFGTYRARKSKGLSLSECLSKEMLYKDCHCKSVFYMGKTYPSTREACRVYKVDYNGFCRYKSYHNLSFKEAMDRYRELQRNKTNKG